MSAPSSFKETIYVTHIFSSSSDPLPGGIRGAGSPGKRCIGRGTELRHSCQAPSVTGSSNWRNSLRLKLFTKVNGNTVLTPEGQSYLETVRGALYALSYFPTSGRDATSKTRAEFTANVRDAHLDTASWEDPNSIHRSRYRYPAVRKMFFFFSLIFFLCACIEKKQTAER